MGKISKAISQIEEIWSPKVHEYNMYLGSFDRVGYNLTYIVAGDKNVKHHHEHYDATLCFVVGSGQVLVNEQLIKYKKGSCFKVPKGVVHQIICDTDTLMITLQNPATTFSAENGWGDIVFDEALF
ncbi:MULTISPECIES: cupin domain-containing protein [unclassified Francisella]|uniref:cupin domain-containing protein n=1 Tax=unclassified Francisella TaxID=2610885 RepID=UPI002E31FBAF|nr:MULTISPECIES: cupin domain-containing protein [unclassified Francisella]MED7820225.1 cupin domain-containing protein [Francisella sp. 19S2-4]MED7831077.1 cupin domain-containing protein [Francisella sp. 19S2-10]